MRSPWGWGDLSNRLCKFHAKSDDYQKITTVTQDICLGFPIRGGFCDGVKPRLVGQYPHARGGGTVIDMHHINRVLLFVYAEDEAVRMMKGAPIWYPKLPGFVNGCKPARDTLQR